MEGEGQRTDALEAIVQQTQATPRYARFHGAYAERLLTSSSAASRYPACTLRHMIMSVNLG